MIRFLSGHRKNIMCCPIAHWGLRRAFRKGSVDPTHSLAPCASAYGGIHIPIFSSHLSTRIHLSPRHYQLHLTLLSWSSCSSVVCSMT